MGNQGQSSDEERIDDAQKNKQIPIIYRESIFPKIPFKNKLFLNVLLSIFFLIEFNVCKSSFPLNWTQIKYYI